MNRREFNKVMGYGALGTGVISTMGFSCQTVVNDISTYVPIGIQAFDTVLSLIDPPLALALAPIVKEVKVAFADLAAAVSAYNNAPASQKATLSGKITTALNVVIQYLQQFWSDANLPNGSLATTIIGVLQLIISTLAAFLPLFGGSVAMKVKFSKQIPIIAIKNPKDQKAFKASVNTVLAKGGYSQRIY